MKPCFISVRRLFRGSLAIVAGFLLGVASAGGQGVDPDQMPGELREVRFDQRLGEMLPLDGTFKTADGREVVLGELFDERPVLLSFVYYECPMLCSLTMNGLAKSLDVLTFNVGEELDVVVVSIDPGEGPAEARQAKVNTLNRYDRPGAERGWYFLTGNEEEIERLTQAAGFAYSYLPESDEYAHSAGILVVTPDGQISKYFYGIEYPPKDVRLALVEASDGEIGSAVDQLLLYCFRFDPELGKYTAATLRILRLGGGIIAFIVLFYVWNTWRLERSRRREQEPTLGAV